MAKLLHNLVLWATASLWHCPMNIFLWHLDRATLAMDTVLMDRKAEGAVSNLIHGKNGDTENRIPYLSIDN